MISDISNLNPEFPSHDVKYFQNRLCGTDPLLIAYVDFKPAGFRIGFDRTNCQYPFESLRNFDRDYNAFYFDMGGVVQEYRRRGVMQAMYDYGRIWVKEHNSHSVTVTALDKRNEMRSFLRKNRYSVWQVRTEICGKPLIKEDYRHDYFKYV
jgi:hypothetical protein